MYDVWMYGCWIVKNDRFLSRVRSGYPRLKVGTCAALVLLKRIMNEELRIMRC